MHRPPIRRLGRLAEVAASQARRSPSPGASRSHIICVHRDSSERRHSRLLRDSVWRRREPLQESVTGRQSTRDDGARPPDQRDWRSPFRIEVEGVA